MKNMFNDKGEIELRCVICDMLLITLTGTITFKHGCSLKCVSCEMFDGGSGVSYKKESNPSISIGDKKVEMLDIPVTAVGVDIRQQKRILVEKAVLLRRPLKRLLVKKVIAIKREEGNQQNSKFIPYLDELLEIIKELARLEGIKWK